MRNAILGLFCGIVLGWMFHAGYPEPKAEAISANFGAYEVEMLAAEQLGRQEPSIHSRMVALRHYRRALAIRPESEAAESAVQILDALVADLNWEHELLHRLSRGHGQQVIDYAGRTGSVPEWLTKEPCDLKRRHQSLETTLRELRQVNPAHQELQRLNLLVQSDAYQLVACGGLP